MSRLGWSLRTNFLPSRLSAPRVDSRFPEWHQMNWRCLCTVNGSSTDLSLPTGLKDITVVDNTRSAVYAVQTLLELPLERRVAWNTQLCKPSGSATVSTSKGLSLSAFAGDDVDFGNGPHLFIASGGSHDDEEVWKLLRRYFEKVDAQKVWFDYFTSMRVLALREVRPMGFSGDIVHMAQLYFDKRKRMDIDTIARSLIAKANRDKFFVLWEKNSLDMDQADTRMWEMKERLDEADISPQWILRACQDAALTHKLDERLRKLLKKTPVHGGAYNMINGVSAMQRNEDVFNLFQTYEKFFQPLVEALYAMELEELPVHFGLLQQVFNEEERTKILLEDDFRRWASTFSSDAIYMDISSPRQLRQVLFAPCQNIHNKTASLPPQTSFKLKGFKRAESSQTRNASKSGEIVLKGAGVKSVSHTKQGWPSTSNSALRDALDNYVSKPSKNVSPGFPEAMESLLQSMEIGRRLKWYASQTEFSSIADKDGRVKMKYMADFYTGHLKNSSNGKDWETIMLQCISPPNGNDLIHIQYPELQMWTIAQLSGCTSLRGRIDSESSSDKLLAYELFLRSSNGDHKAFLSDVSREQCHAASMLDKAIHRGGDLSVVKTLVGCSEEEVVPMVKKWYDLHPGVLRWRKGREAFINEHGFAETYMGRRKKVKRGHVGEGVGFIVNGTASEIVMGGIIGLRGDERIAALGWHVVHADRDGIVLEGPAWATAAFLEFLEDVVHRPTGFELRIPPRVTIYHIAGEKEEVDVQLSQATAKG